jgi:hypothetical protein
MILYYEEIKEPSVEGNSAGGRIATANAASDPLAPPLSQRVYL